MPVETEIKFLTLEDVNRDGIIRLEKIANNFLSEVDKKIDNFKSQVNLNDDDIHRVNGWFLDGKGKLGVFVLFEDGGVLLFGKDFEKKSQKKIVDQLGKEIEVESYSVDGRLSNLPVEGKFNYKRVLEAAENDDIIEGLVRTFNPYLT